MLRRQLTSFCNWSPPGGMPPAVTHDVVLDSMQRDRETLARSPPGTRAGGSLQIPSCQVSRVLRCVFFQLTLKPVGHQSTN